MATCVRVHVRVRVGRLERIHGPSPTKALFGPYLVSLHAENKIWVDAPAFGL